MIDVLGHIGYILLVTGTILISCNRTSGWLFRLVGSLVWIVLGFHLRLSSVVFWGIVFAGIEARGFITWRRRVQAPARRDC